MHSTLAAVQGVWSGDVLHGVNLAGGLHHSMPASASGFCLYNDLAVGIQWALDNGAERVAYVDVDVHHGDGVQEVFADEPRVLTISLHESPESLFPGTGYPNETGRARTSPSARSRMRANPSSARVRSAPGSTLASETWIESSRAGSRHLSAWGTRATLAGR